MFDISWTEFLLIGVVALVVIGPKELPGVMRTLGQYTRKIRSMAADFQGQFQEAMREAEMADLKKQVDDMAQDIKSYDPLKDVRADVEAIGKDISTNLADPAAAQPAKELPLPEAAAQLEDQSVVASAAGPVAPDAAAESAPAPEAAMGLHDPAVAASATGPATPEAVAESVASDSAGRTE
jgi:sec-independent protein translocase protein TatB